MKTKILVILLFLCLTQVRAQYGVAWSSANLGSYGWGGAYGYDVDSDGLVEFEVRANSQYAFYNGSFTPDWTISFPGYNYVYAVHPRDTDGDGRVVPLNTDADGAGELVVTGYYLSGSTYYGRIRIYDASSHGLEWESPEIAGFSGSATEEDIDGDGRCEIIITRYTSTESYVDVYHCTTGIEEDRTEYEAVTAVSPRPNPASVSVRIPFSVGLKDEGELLKVSIHDAAGRQVKILAAERPAVPGDYSLIWDGRDDNGREAPSGSYAVLVRIGRDVVREAIVLVR